MVQNLRCRYSGSRPKLYRSGIYLMSKKHWIYIKRGLSEDPKHREAMGNKVWLYMHIIDQADWETGIVREWRDKDQADEMQMQLRTMRDQRQELERLGYITCKQGRGKQQITIAKWIDPRNYSGKVLNNGDKKVSPSEFDGDTHGDTHGDTDGSTQNVTTSLYPKAKGHLTRAKTARVQSPSLA